MICRLLSYKRPLLLLMLLTGAIAAQAQSGLKAGDTKLVIPDYPTSKDQYMFATMYKQGQIISRDSKRRQEQLSKVAQCFERIVIRFPDDQMYTPRAFLELGDCAAQAEGYKTATNYYNSAIQRYPDDEYIQARAMCALGLIHDIQKKHELAKGTYKEIMDRFSNSRNGAVREIVKRASGLYFKVHETKQEKKRFTMKSLVPFGKKDN